MNIFDHIFAFLKANQMVSGGFALGLVGGLVAALKGMPAKAYTWLKGKLTVSVEIRDPHVFDYFAEWLADQSYGARCRRLAAVISRKKDDHTVLLVPGPGFHFFRSNGRIYWFDRKRDNNVDSKLQHEEAVVINREIIYLRTWGRSSATLRAMLQQAADHIKDKYAGKCVVYSYAGWDGWRVASANDGRMLNSVILPDGVIESIVRDIEQFRTGMPWYKDTAIPYRRGYLFHGPPGCGKSSLVAAIAAHFGMNLYMVNLNSSISDHYFNAAMSATLPNSILLFEDVDAAFVGRKGENEQQLSFSCLLNAIDGVAAQQGRIVIFTTNHRNKLDPALLRPGRVDREFEIGHCTNDQLQKLFLRFFPNEQSLAETFAALLDEGYWAPCEIQQHLMLYRDDPEGALTHPIRHQVEETA